MVIMVVQGFAIKCPCFYLTYALFWNLLLCSRSIIKIKVKYRILMVRFVSYFFKSFIAKCARWWCTAHGMVTWWKNTWTVYILNLTHITWMSLFRCTAQCLAFYIHISRHVRCCERKSASGLDLYFFSTEPAGLLHDFCREPVWVLGSPTKSTLLWGPPNCIRIMLQCFNLYFQTPSVTIE